MNKTNKSLHLNITFIDAILREMDLRPTTNLQQRLLCITQNIIIITSDVLLSRKGCIQPGENKISLLSVNPCVSCPPSHIFTCVQVAGCPPVYGLWVSSSFVLLPLNFSFLAAPWYWGEGAFSIDSLFRSSFAACFTSGRFCCCRFPSKVRTGGSGYSTYASIFLFLFKFNAMLLCETQLSAEDRSL